MSFEEAMRSIHSSKCLEAMKDELKSMSTIDVWALEEILKGAANGSTRQNMTPKRMQKDTKRDFWRKTSHREKAQIIMRLFLQSHARILLEL